MKIIQPCCTPKHLRELRNAIGKNGSAEFMGYGDLSLTELLPALLTNTDDVNLLIAAPSMPEQATDIIVRWLRVEWPRMDGRGKVFAIRHLTIVADLSKHKSPVASGWLKDNPFGDRLTLIDKEQEETVILLPDFAITGPVNLRYGHEFTATATTKAEDVAALWDKYKPASVAETSAKIVVKSVEPEADAEETAVARMDSDAEPTEKAETPAEESVKEESPKKEKPGPEAGQQEG